MLNFVKSQKGLAMPIIVAIIAIIFLFCVTVLTLNENLTRNVSFNATREDALHIAEAGFNKYLYYLNKDTYFYKKASAGPYDEFIPIDPTSNPRIYQPVEYKNGTEVLGKYQIEVIPPSTSEIYVTVKSTGWAEKNTAKQRVLEVKIYKRQFTNYVELAGDMSMPGVGNVYWGDGEQIYGPFFTNGELRTQGRPEFHNTVNYCKGTYAGSAIFSYFTGYRPEKSDPLIFPKTNDDVKDWGFPANGGVTYTGLTCIYLKADGTYDVLKETNERALSQPFPSSGVIYVQGDLFISGTLKGRLTVCASGNIYITGKDPTNLNPKDSSIRSTGGIVYSNTDIPLTQGATHTSEDMLGLITSGQTLIATKSWPMLSGGKIVRTTKYSYSDVAIKNIKVYAAILGIGGNSYYGVENYSSMSDYGYIYLYGSKSAQRCGATFSQSGSRVYGYKENNQFDWRMKYDTPPHYLEPANAGWEIRSWKELN